MEMVLMDEQGNRIQASVLRKWLVKFERILKQGDCFFLRNFGVVDSESNLKFVDHRYKLIFSYNSKVTVCNNFSGSLFGFSFVDFKKIHRKEQPENIAFDVIGDIIYCGSIVSTDNNKRILSFELQDLEGLTLDVTLWDKYAQQVSDYLENTHLKGHVVLIIQFAKLKYFNGKPYLSNDYLGSRLLFKYINKGPDRVSITFDVGNNDEQQEIPVDEIKEFYNCRYLSACEACWRIFSYDVHYRTPPVKRLPFHLPDQQQVVYQADDHIDEVLDKTSNHSHV